MQQTYRELCPEAKLEHLSQTVMQLWSEQTPVWWAMDTEQKGSPGEPLGCLWLGQAVDQVSGDRYTQVFLLYVCPTYRRRGLGQALMHLAERWALQQGHSQIGLHTFVSNAIAQSFYTKLGYQPQATFLRKSLNRSG